MGAGPQPGPRPRAARRRAAVAAVARPAGVRRRAAHGGRAARAAARAAGQLDRARPTTSSASRPLAPAAPAADRGPTARPAGPLLAAVGADPDAPPAGRRAAAPPALTGSEAVAALRTAYRDELLVLAAADLGGRRRAGAAGAGRGGGRRPARRTLARRALRAALAVRRRRGSGGEHGPARASSPWASAAAASSTTSATSTSCSSRSPPTPPPTRLASRVMRIVGEACFEVDANLRPEGPAGRAGAHARRPRRPTTSGGRRRGSSRRCSRPDRSRATRSWAAAYAEAVAPLVWSAAGRAGLRRRRAGHAPARRGERAARPRGPGAQARPGRAARRRVRGAAAAARARAHRRGAALADRRWTRWRRWPTAATSAATTARTWPPPTGSCGCSSTGCSCSGCGAPTCCPPRTTPTRCAGSPAPPRLRPDGRHDVVGVLTGGVDAATPAGCGGCTRSCSTGRCSLRCRGCRPRRRGCRESAAAARLGALGWTSPEGALRHLRALTGGVSRAAAIQQTLLPVLLDELARSPDPDRGLLAYRRVSEALATHAVVPAAAARRGAGRAAADAAARHLGAGPGPAGAGAGGAAAARRAGRRAGRRADPRPGRGRHLAAAPPWRARPTRTAPRPRPARCAATRCCGWRARTCSACCRTRQVCAALSSVWVAVLQATLESVQRAIGRRRAGGPRGRGDRHGPARRGRAGLRQRRRRAVRLRARRGRDRPARRCRYATTVAETVRRRLGRPSPDPALVVDADLRPEGRNGPLVRTLDSYRATTRAGRRRGRRRRCCGPRRSAGDADLARRFVEMIDPIRYPVEGIDPATSPRSGGSRRGWTRSGCRAAPTAATHTKLGHGGLADVEWTVQLLQLQHAGDLPELRTTSTLDGLREAGEAGLLTAADARGAGGGLDDGHPGAQRGDAGPRQARRPAAALGPRAGRGGLRRWATRPTATPACSSTTTAAPPGAPAPSSSGCSTAGRPNRWAYAGSRELPWPGAVVETLLTFALAGWCWCSIPGPSVLFIVGRALAHGRRAALTSPWPATPPAPSLVVVVVRSGSAPSPPVDRGVHRAQAGRVPPTWSTWACTPTATAATSSARLGRHTGHERRGCSGRASSSGVTNPKVLIFFAAVLPQFVDIGAGRVTSQMLVLGLVFALIAAGAGQPVGAGRGHRAGLVRHLAGPAAAPRRRRRPHDGRDGRRAGVHRSQGLSLRPPALRRPVSDWLAWRVCWRSASTR